MYVFIGDETNRTQGERRRFFIYGGLFVPTDSIASLDARITSIRQEAGLRSTDPLKFDTRSRPEETTTIEAYTKAKNDVIDACIAEDIKFSAYLILHDIAAGGEDELLGFALNSILYVFDGKFLARKNDQGIAVVDRFSGDYAMLREKFTRGVFIDSEQNWVKLPRIKMYASTCDGASHLSSAADIVLGAFRYCVNEHEKTDVPKQLLPRLVQMMYHRKVGETHYVRDFGLIMRPKRIRVSDYQSEYDALVDRWTKLLKESEDKTDGQGAA